MANMLHFLHQYLYVINYFHHFYDDLLCTPMQLSHLHLYPFNKLQ